MADWCQYMAKSTARSYERFKWKSAAWTEKREWKELIELKKAGLTALQQKKNEEQKTLRYCCNNKSFLMMFCNNKKAAKHTINNIKKKQ